MFNLRLYSGKISVLLLITSIMIFMISCSENTNPLNTNSSASVDSETGSSGITDLKIIALPQTPNGLQKIISDSKMIYVYQGGILSLNSGKDFQLIDLIKKAPYPVTTYTLGQALLPASPLSAEVLVTLCENTNLHDDYWMLTVLQQNAPLRKCVLDKMVEKNFVTNSYYLKEILVASSPLPQSVLSKIYQLNLTQSDRNLVLAAQVGQRLDELAYNNAGGGLRISLYIPPYSLTQNTYISMTTDDALLMGDVYLTFGPHGTVFNPPALLDFEVSGLDLTGVNPDLVDIYYDNQDTGEWELMPSKSITIDTQTGYIKVDDAQFSHFSRYAIGMR